MSYPVFNKTNQNICFLERPVKLSICGTHIFTPTAGEVTNDTLLPQVGQFEALIFILFILGDAEEGRGVVLFVFLK